jgi:hypothetical protein
VHINITASLSSLRLDISFPISVMGNSDDDRNGDQSARNSNDAEDLFTRTNTNRHLDNHFTSLFSTLWSLPSTIYQRGNEHGREFNRLFDEQRKEREEEQEREDGRGTRACGWRGRRRCHDRQERDVDVKDQEEKDTETVMDDWVNKVGREVERGEKEAQELYNEWWRKMEGEGAGEKERKQLPIFEQAFGSMKGSEPSDAKPDWKGRQQEKAKAKEDNAWAEIFPAWSSKTAPAPEDETKPHEHVFGREQRDRPLTSAARDVEDTIDKLHQDFERWMGATSQWGQFFQNGYMRDSRLWEDEGLFGPSMPFSRPLSTIFSLGMRPFLPQDSAMAYLLYSEYSPLHLEHEKGFDASFRRRFEDLVRVKSGKEMLKDDEEKEKVGTKVEWIGRIVPLLKEGDGTLKGSITIGSTGDRQDVVQIEEGDRIPTPTPAAPMPERTPPDVQADEGP